MFSRRHLNSSGNSQTRKKINWEYYNPPANFTPAQCCLDSSLHGLQYIGQKNRHCFERIFWLIAFIASVACAGMLTYQLWETYTNSPIVTQFNPIETELWKLPFPAVTFCNVNKLIGSIIEEYKKMGTSFKNSNDTTYLKSLAALVDINNICGQDTMMKRNVDALNTTSWTDWYDSFAEDFERRKNEYEKYINPSELLLHSSQKCSEMLVFCMWHDEVINCSELFRPIITDYGYCCTFNMIPPTLLLKNFNESADNQEEIKEWKEAEVTSDNLILPSASRHKFPYRQQYPSRSSGLSVMLEPNLREYTCTSTDSEGFVVGLKGPLDFPRMEDDGMLVQPGVETFVKIHPQITIPDKSIRKFHLRKRNCVFDDESDYTNLQFYTKYTTTNCLSECISGITKVTCKCVSYYMLQSPGVPLCKPEKYNCTNGVEKNAIRECAHCHRSCTDIQYQAEVTALPIRKLHAERLLAAYRDRKKTDDLAIVHLYFGQPAYQTRLRKEMEMSTTCLYCCPASAGGLLGLCLGFSMLSVLEIFYYCTIRLCFNYRRKRKYVEKTETRLDRNRRISPSSGESEDNRLFKRRSSAKIKKFKAPSFKIVQGRSFWPANI